MIVKKIVLFFVGVCFIEAAKKLPSYFPQCKRFDPELNKCLLKASETVKPFLSTGVPELGIPKIEPFFLPAVTLQQGTQALNFKAVIYNTKIQGLSNYKFSQFDFDTKKLIFTAKAVISPIKLEGEYNVTGKILLAPIVGAGTYKAQIDKADVSFYQTVKETKNKRGVVYILPDNTTTKINVEKPKARLEGLFDGNEELNNATNRIINDNVDELFIEFKPVVEEVITNILQDLLLAAFENQIPYDDLYPPS